MQKSNWMDFTPLIDVFLILLFVILMNSTAEKDALAEAQTLETQYFQEIINQQGSIIDSLESQLSLQPDLLDSVTYAFLRERVAIVPLELKTQNNQLWVDNSPTDLYLLYNDQNTPALRARQKNQIKQELTAYLQDKTSGKSLTLFTLTEDGTVYRYAYVLTQEALSELTRELGNDRTYFLEIPNQ